MLVGTYRGAPFANCEFLVGRLCELVNKQIKDVRQPGRLDETLPESIILAIATHVWLEWTHPYGDGNGRTGRLLEHFVLLESGVPDLVCHLLSNFYNKTKERYIEMLQAATKKGLHTFLSYAIEGFRDELEGLMLSITDYQVDMTWNAFVSAQFAGLSRTSDLRRKALAEEMPLAPTSFANLLLQVSKLYLGLNVAKALPRDLQHLVEQGLVAKDESGSFRANIDRVLQFLPNVKCRGGSEDLHQKA